MFIRKWVPVLAVLGILAGAIGCGTLPGSVTGSGHPETRTFDLTGFTGVQAAAAFQVEISRAEAYKVQVTADDNLWDVLDISVSGSSLRLRTKSGVSLVNSTLKASVTMPSLRIVDLSGASRAEATGFLAGDDFNGTLSGASSLDAQDMKLGSATFDISGASRVSGTSITFNTARFVISGAGLVRLAGSGQSASVAASGGSQAILNELALQDVSVNLSGGSQARVNARNITSADLSGGSTLRYADSPTMGKVQTSGGSSIGHE